MPSKPIERFVKQQIADQGGWERIKERYASGETITAITRTLRRPDGQPVSRAIVYRLIKKQPGLLAELQTLKPECAAALFEKGLEVTDAMPADRDAVLRDRAKTDVYFRAAGFLDREQFGEQKPTVAVHVNLTDLHLNALRQREVVPSAGLPGSGSSIESDEARARVGRGDSSQQDHGEQAVSSSLSLT